MTAVHGRLWGTVGKGAGERAGHGLHRLKDSGQHSKVLHPRESGRLELLVKDA